jgi:hypothetical protein
MTGRYGRAVKLSASSSAIMIAIRLDTIQVRMKAS